MPEDQRDIPLPPSGPYEDPRSGQSILREQARQGMSGAATAMAEAERNRAPPPGAVDAVRGIPGIAGPVDSPAAPSDFDILIGRNTGIGGTPGFDSILTERERRLLRERPSELDRLLASGPEDDFLRGQEKKAARAARRDTRSRPFVIPGIRGNVSRGGAAADIFAQQATDWAYWLGREFAGARDELGRNFPNDPGRRGRPARRVTGPDVARSRTNRTGAAATRRQPAPAPSNSRAPPREPPSSPRDTTGSTRELPSGRDPVARTPRTPRTPTRTPTVPTTVPGPTWNIPGRPGMPDLVDLLVDRSPARARTPMRMSAGGGGPPASFAPTTAGPSLNSPSGGLAPPSSPATAVPGLTPFEAPLLGLSTQTQPQREDCDCPKPTRTRRKFDCSNPLVSRSVSEKDGIITIKRKLVCPPSKRKSP